MHAIQLTLKSANRKIGRIPVSTTSADSCGNACPLMESGCYAKYGPLGMLWALLSEQQPGTDYENKRGNRFRALSWKEFCAKIAALPDATLWRHNQAGDLPGKGNAIDCGALGELVAANRGKRGFTYTHKPLGLGSNAAAIAAANKDGFTVNLSANNLAHADKLADAGVGPVVTILPRDIQGNVRVETPAGRRVVVCPATYREDMTCARCQLCAVATRKTIVGFPAHGASSKRASAVAESGQ